MKRRPRRDGTRLRLGVFVAALSVLAVVAGCADANVAADDPAAAPSPTASRDPDFPRRTPPPLPAATSSPVLAVPTGAPSGTDLPAGAVRARVARVVDGDTIDVDIGGERERVRLLLVDTPEVYGGSECYGAEASAYTRRIAPPGTSIALQRDVTDRDRYGRLLRYVYLSGGEMLNELLVRDGYAAVATYPPDVRYVDVLLEAQAEARVAGRGLWSACESATSPPSAPEPAPTSSPGASAGDCDPSYPDVCIPRYPPDLDCSDVRVRRFRVIGDDPHGFDRDGDGVGCES